MLEALDFIDQKFRSAVERSKVQTSQLAIMIFFVVYQNSVIVPSDHVELTNVTCVTPDNQVDI